MTPDNDPAAADAVDGPRDPQTLSETIHQLAQHPGQVSASVYQLMSERLRVHVLRSTPGLSFQDSEDVATDLLLKLVARVQTLGPLPNDRYVYRAARNAAIDQMRRNTARQSREVPDLSVHADNLQLATDDDVSAAFDAAQTAASVMRALQTARQRNDQVTFLVVTTALDQTQSLGHRPSNRMLAGKLNLSHTTVNKALARFREYLHADQPQP